MASPSAKTQLLTAIALSAAILGFQFYRAHRSALAASSAASVQAVTPPIPAPTKP